VYLLFRGVCKLTISFDVINEFFAVVVVDSCLIWDIDSCDVVSAAVSCDSCICYIEGMFAVSMSMMDG